MTTTVNRVYVDAEGVVRMSPTGWPEEKELKGITGHITMTENQAALEKAKEESIPFEDQEFFEDCKSMVLGEFYTIEPVHVKLQHQYYTNYKLPKWQDCNIQQYDDLKSSAFSVRIVARIVTEEEKPADYETPLHSLVNGLMQPAPDIVPESVCAKCGGVGFYHLGTHTRITCSCLRPVSWSSITPESRQPAPDDFAKAKRVIRDETGKAIGFEPFIKEPAPNITNQDEWTLSRVKMPDFDGMYYVYGFMHHSCGNVTPFHKIVECRMNQWIKSDVGEQMTYWRNLLKPPIIEEDEYQ